MTQPETDSSLRAKIGYLETRNAYEHHDLTSQIEVLQIQVERLEAELEDRPMVFAIQHIETKQLHKGCFVDLYESVEAAESAIRTEFFHPELWKVVIYTRMHCNDTA